MRLALAPQALVLSVADDGHGFDPELQGRGSGEHLGLAAIREMVAGLGGRTEVTSAPGQGTRVCALVPLREPAP